MTMNALLIGLLLLAPQQQDSGKAIFLGKGTCYVCHGRTGRGTAMAPNLTDAIWLNIDGTHQQIVQLVKQGVPHPKRYRVAMPAMGGASLLPKEVEAVARYVVSLRSVAKAPAAGGHEHAQQADTASAPEPGDHACAMCMQRNGGGRGCGMRESSSADSANAPARPCARCRRGS
jgi:cytochrome c